MLNKLFTGMQNAVTGQPQQGFMPQTPQQTPFYDQPGYQGTPPIVPSQTAQMSPMMALLRAIRQRRQGPAGTIPKNVTLNRMIGGGY